MHFGSYMKIMSNIHINIMLIMFLVLDILLLNDYSDGILYTAHEAQKTPPPLFFGLFLFQEQNTGLSHYSLFL